MKTVTKVVTTIWAGRAWIHAKYLNKAKNGNLPLVINYKTGKMTIQPEDLKEKFDRNKTVKDNYKSGVTHKHYGVPFKLDV